MKEARGAGCRVDRGGRRPHRAVAAASLVATDRILPVLDGFDEIPGGLHRAALEAFNTTTLPLLLTSRPEEYAAAVAGTDVLTAAGGVRLLTRIALAGAVAAAAVTVGHPTVPRCARHGLARVRGFRGERDAAGGPIRCPARLNFFPPCGQTFTRQRSETAQLSCVTALVRQMWNVFARTSAPSPSTVDSQRGRESGCPA